LTRLFFAEAGEWARGRQWLPRALLLLVCAWIFYRHLQDPFYGGIVKGLNLAIHEIGHVMFGFVGEFIGIAGGTILQLAAPAITVWLFYRQRDFFAIAIALCWLGTSLFDVAVYAADARAGDLPLVGLGDGDPQHDWFILLAETDLLNHDKTIGGIFRAFGILSFLGGLLFGGWLVKTSATVKNAAALFLAATLISGCIAPLRMPQDNTPMKGSTSTGSLGRKPVSAKREPTYLIAVDGTECTVSIKKFKKVKVGDAVFCLWSSPAAGL
jgi:hypothetical protein